MNLKKYTMKQAINQV